MIEYVTGNIFNSGCFAAINPVNCVGVMGAGLAKQFKEKYPKMFNRYREECSSEKMKLGRNYFWINPNSLQSNTRCTDYGEFAEIICMPTKNHWKDSSELNWIILALQDLREHVIVNYAPSCSIAIPKIGCGLGGLNWETQVKPEIEKYLGDLEHNIKVYV
jgi:O-acetyl-ADP-ribose deacetylase (regulator of RNase III)